MSISIRDVQPNRFFVRSYAVREIIADLGEEVKYRTYLLETGEPISSLPALCSKRQIFRWAEREATNEEISRMQILLATQNEQGKIQEISDAVIASIPDELLLEEVRRRGLSI